jgi:phosphate starvation-inducible PhoH-like protein
VAYTIVVPEADVLKSICGTNDSNLKLIEEHLGVSVFCTGNEISIENDDKEITDKFRFIIDRLSDEIADGNDGDIIHSILNLKGTSLSAVSINIPGSLKKILPKTANQAALMSALRSYDIVFAEGPAGSGKTYLAMAEALWEVLTHKKNGIVLTRPVVEAGENLGFLPGDLEDKINPYLRPLYDAMNTLLPRETVKRLSESGVIEIAPLAYMRGRTINNSVIILDEAQNTTREQMKMFLTRMGEDSKVFVTGDVTQVDLPSRVPSGLIQAMELLSKISEIKIMRLTSDDVVRNPLVKKIVQAYEYAGQ